MLDFGTRAIHVGYDPSQEVYNPVIPPVVYSGNESFRHESNLKNLEECIASLEYAKYGLCYPCGNAASSYLTQLLKVGDHAIVFDSVYHGTKLLQRNNFINNFGNSLGLTLTGTRTNFSLSEKLGKIQVSFVDLRDSRVLEHHLKENTKMVWIETPSNPTMKIVDIEAIANILKKKAKDVILVVDNTFMTPYFQNPLLLGADIVMHSLTKFMNGHSDILMGAVATNSDKLYSRLKEVRDVAGGVPSPMDCFLVHRGIKTLHLRMEQHTKNAWAIAQYLEQHPKVERVFYPGLASHPQHELAKKQCKGFSGMVSVCIRGGSQEAMAFVRNLRLFTLAVSLGSPESLVEIPSLMTASALTKEMQKELEVTENLLRMSIGIENIKDLIADIEQALENI